MTIVLAGSRPPKHIRRNSIELANWYRMHAPDLANAIERSGWTPTKVISGGAQGFDALGERWSKARNIEVERVLPDYERYGRYLAPKHRNRAMESKAQALIACWDGQSGGTRDMIEVMREAGKPAFVYRIPQNGGAYTLASMPRENWLNAMPPWARERA